MGSQRMAHGPKQTASAAGSGLRGLQTCDPTQLGSRLLDRTLHLELELDGSDGKWLLHRCQCHPPVQEMITSGDQGQLVDFFDLMPLPSKADHLLQNQEQRQRLGQCARQRILEGGYDLQNASETTGATDQSGGSWLTPAIQSNATAKGSITLQQVIQKLPMFFLRKAYRNLADETGILVNLGLALMQQGLVDQAERAYRLALDSNEQRVRRSAAKNLGFLLLWRGDHQQGWHWHGKRFEGESFEANQWRGDPLNGETLTVWNDVGMGDAFQFVRYTLPLLQTRRKGALCRSEIANFTLFRDHLAWPLSEVIDRRSFSPAEGGPHIPLMSLIALLDANTLWGRRFHNPHGKYPNGVNETKNRWVSVGQVIPRPHHACL